MLKKFIILLFIFGSFACSSNKDDAFFELKKDKYYPQWLICKNVISAYQTSGITYLNTDSFGIKHFLIADDIGKIHHVTMKDSVITDIKPVVLSESVMDYLSDYHKLDFEEISYDRHTGAIYLSIEGNDPNPKEYAGIFKLNFAEGNIFSDTIASIEKLKIEPESLFKKYVDNNIGYEGLAADKNYLYLGLEGFAEGEVFADSTIIFVVDKKTLRIIKELSTKGMDIQSTCALYSDADNSLYGIDRNNKKVFHLLLGSDGDGPYIQQHYVTKIESPIPGYPEYNYVAALESITMDEDKNIYIVDDPWKTYFIPSKEILNKMDSTTINNFKKFIPVIYKFKF